MQTSPPTPSVLTSPPGVKTGINYAVKWHQLTNLTMKLILAAILLLSTLTFKGQDNFESQDRWKIGLSFTPVYSIALTDFSSEESIMSNSFGFLTEIQYRILK
jgi:hypothetical protein